MPTTNLLKTETQELKLITGLVVRVLLERLICFLDFITLESYREMKKDYQNLLKEKEQQQRLQDAEDLKARKTVINETLENNILEDLDSFCVNVSGELTSEDEHWTGGAIDGVIPYLYQYTEQDGTLQQEVEFLFFFSYE